ncbi:hypothetical protein MFIFM68171_10428 [Madurella fahalii]|uniref:Uncharacterized protein n=1 Tax=Madurella fahalii TaxID=1157608 RepID=A0ABQ0GR56_9PEZI
MSQTQQDQWRNWRQNLKPAKGKSKRSENSDHGTVRRNYEIIVAILNSGKEIPDLSTMVSTAPPPSRRAATASTSAAPNQQRSRKHQSREKRQASTSPAGKRPSQRTSHSTLDRQGPVAADNEKAADNAVNPGPLDLGQLSNFQAPINPLRWTLPDSQIDPLLLDQNLLSPYSTDISRPQEWLVPLRLQQQQQQQQQQGGMSIAAPLIPSGPGTVAPTSTLVSTTIPRSIDVSDARSRTSATSAGLHETLLSAEALAFAAPLPEVKGQALIGLGAVHENAAVADGLDWNIDRIGDFCWSGPDE